MESPKIYVRLIGYPEICFPTFLVGYQVSEMPTTRPVARVPDSMSALAIMRSLTDHTVGFRFSMMSFPVPFEATEKRRNVCTSYLKDNGGE